MTDIVTILAVGLIAIINIVAFSRFSQDMRQATREIERVKGSQTWSKKRELEANKMLKKLTKLV